VQAPRAAPALGRSDLRRAGAPLGPMTPHDVSVVPRRWAAASPVPLVEEVRDVVVLVLRVALGVDAHLGSEGGGAMQCDGM
jgi:hypothetical protein